MNRRTFLLSSSMAAALASAQTAASSRKYTADWNSLKSHPLPAWYDDAKFGIFIHWGLYSVPAWAEPSGELGKVDPGKWFYHNPYAEWYLNSIRLKESGAYAHHAATYGADFDYYRFGKQFEEQNRQWKAESWAALFKSAGARYAVLTTKHHDGYTLWPSAVKNPVRPQGGINSKRDLVGELTTAVRKSGLKMGLYYSGGLDWTFEKQPIAKGADLKTTAPQSQQYADYAYAHWRELIERYQPSILWNDISYPKAGKVEQLFADYYNGVPEGVVDNRFSVDWADFTTPEYAKYDQITPKKWESCRGLGFSFGYNQVEGPAQVLAAGALIELLVDIVSKNGNLLLNIGPKPDGSISDIQLDRLNALGRWLAVNGDGIYGSRPWLKPAAKTAEGLDVRFTQKAGNLHAFVFGTPEKVTLKGLTAPAGMTVRVPGVNQPVQWKQSGGDIAMTLPGKLPAAHVAALVLSPAPKPV